MFLFSASVLFIVRQPVTPSLVLISLFVSNQPSGVGQGTSGVMDGGRVEDEVWSASYTDCITLTTYLPTITNPSTDKTTSTVVVLSLTLLSSLSPSLWPGQVVSDDDETVLLEKEKVGDKIKYHTTPKHTQESLYLPTHL